MSQQRLALLRRFACPTVLVALSACSGTQAAPRANVPATRPAISAGSGAAIAVARDVDVYEAPWGSPLIGHVEEGDVLEHRDDGFVRVRTTTGAVLTGYSVAPRDPRTGRGIGLFVTHDTAIVDERGGPLGKAHRGAFLPLVRFVGQTVHVALPPFGLEGRVPLASLVASRMPPATPEPPNYPRFVENRELGITTGAGLAKAVCAEPIGILDEESSGVRVAQSVAGIEIIGTALHAGRACTPRHVRKRGASTIPPGYRAPTTFRTEAFARSQDFWLVERDDRDDLVCAKWTYRRAKAGSGTMEATRVVSGDSYTLTYDLAGAAPVIERPTALELVPRETVVRDARGKRVTNRGEGIALCGNQTAMVVGEIANGIVTLPGVSETGESLVAYHPDDVDVWYTRRDACEAAALRAHPPGQARIARLVAPVKPGC